MEMRKTRLNTLLVMFRNLNKIKLRISPGMFLDEIELREYDDQLHREGIFFTRRQIIDALSNDGYLFIKENNKEGVLELEMINQNIHFQRTSPDVVKVRLYKKEIKELYEFSKDFRQALMDRERSVGLPNGKLS